MNRELITNEKGIAMLVALVVVVLLVALIVEFDYGTRVALTTAGTFRDGVQATYLAKSGVRAAQAILKDDAKQSPAYDATTELWATPLPSYPVGNGFVSLEIADESSKLNINLLQKPADREKWEPIWERLFKELEIDPAVLDAIKDWVDEDDLAEGLFGAEASYYERLDPPYTCKNGPLDSLGELRLIRGVTQEIYDKFTTGCGGRPCITIAPAKGVNLNTISIEVCQALHEDLDEDSCQRLVEGRPYENIVNDVEAVAGWGGTGGIRFNLQRLGLITVKSSHFSIQARGEVNETQRVVEALVKRQGQKVQLLRWRLE